MRGQPSKGMPSALGERIIPARAGPTERCRAMPGDWTDHPRSCGANAMIAISPPEICGSSPLVRGQHSGVFRRVAKIRIIPARAGPTAQTHFTVMSDSDHPRSCGANAVCDIGCKRCCGSSPLVRGQRNHPPPLSRRYRIIPARAGPTIFRIKKDMIWTDHPRSCGANSAVW